MTPTVLLVSTTTRWLGTARMPRVLARAGLDVALLAPADSLATKSRYVSRIGVLPATATPMEWLLSLVQMIGKVAPRALVPCDEMAVRLLFMLVLEPPPGLDAMLQAQLTRLIIDSVGDPRFYAASIDKTLLPAAAEALGVRVPPYAIATSVKDAQARADDLGYPVVLKRRFGFAGHGVAILSTRNELADAARRLLSPDQLDIGERRSPALLVQAFIAGPYHSQALVALRGQPLQSFAWERLVATAPVKGQTAVLRFIRSPETREPSEALCRAFGIAGFFNVQFVIDERSGAAQLLEINRRIVTHTHLGERNGRDLGVALARALEGKPPAATPAADDCADDRIVIFPREWLRDPQSGYLAEIPADVPWDEPELFAAMLAMRHEG
ncbi:MAG: ATP-grasp domain-containing protein [Betaproteobacteria bacterium]|nr:ATP-grasp domain-containing protein [Betaproteobacteria bacterium]